MFKPKRKIKSLRRKDEGEIEEDETNLQKAKKRQRILSSLKMGKTTTTTESSISSSVKVGTSSNDEAGSVRKGDDEAKDLLLETSKKDPSDAIIQTTLDATDVSNMMIEVVLPADERLQMIAETEKARRVKNQESVARRRNDDGGYTGRAGSHRQEEEEVEVEEVDNRSVDADRIGFAALRGKSTRKKILSDDDAAYKRFVERERMHKR